MAVVTPTGSWYGSACREPREQYGEDRRPLYETLDDDEFVEPVKIAPAHAEPVEAGKSSGLKDIGIADSAGGRAPRADTKIGRRANGHRAKCFDAWRCWLDRSIVDDPRADARDVAFSAELHRMEQSVDLLALLLGSVARVAPRPRESGNDVRGSAAFEGTDVERDPA